MDKLPLYVPALENFKTLMQQATGLSEQNGSFAEILAGFDEQIIRQLSEDPVFQDLHTMATNPVRVTTNIASEYLHQLLTGSMKPQEYAVRLEINRASTNEFYVGGEHS